MTPPTTVKDMSGRDLAKGDTVSTLTGQMTGKICNLADEEDASFICIRPPHQPYGHGVWHAADRCVLVTPARPKESNQTDKKTQPSKSSTGQSSPNATRTRKKPAKKK